jgi:hypothetical protein
MPRWALALVFVHVIVFCVLAELLALFLFDLVNVADRWSGWARRTMSFVTAVTIHSAMRNGNTAGLDEPSRLTP